MDHLLLKKLIGWRCLRWYKKYCKFIRWTEFIHPLLLLFSCEHMPDCLQLHKLQHTRLPCFSPSPGVSSDSCLLSWWCHPTISSSVIPFSSCFQSFPASGCFPKICSLASGDQSTGASASASVLPINIQGWFLLGLIGSPWSPTDSQESCPASQFKASILWC